MAKHINLEEAKKEVKALVSEIAEISIEDIRDEAQFAEDLGVDSMMALEIIAKIEKNYKIVIPEEEIPTIRSLQDVYALLERSLKKKDN